jgi:hypothetical protein
MNRRSVQWWLGVLLLAVGIGSCAPVTSPQTQQWQYEEAKRYCVSCFGLYDSRCQEPQLSMYVGKGISAICGRGGP